MEYEIMHMVNEHYQDFLSASNSKFTNIPLRPKSSHVPHASYSPSEARPYPMAEVYRAAFHKTSMSLTLHATPARHFHRPK